MSRTSNDEYDEKGMLINGFDSWRQAWVLNGTYVRCGHPEDMNCDCYGRLHAGEKWHKPGCAIEKSKPEGHQYCCDCCIRLMLKLESERSNPVQSI